MIPHCWILQERFLHMMYSVAMIPTSVGMIPTSVGMIPTSVGMVPTCVRIIPTLVEMCRNYSMHCIKMSYTMCHV